MRVDYEHSLELEDVYRRLNQLFSVLPGQYPGKIGSLQIVWNPEHTRMMYNVEITGLSLRGVKIIGCSSNGHVTLTDGLILLDGKLPFIARPIRGKIEEKIRMTLDDILS